MSGGYDMKRNHAHSNNKGVVGIAGKQIALSTT